MINPLLKDDSESKRQKFPISGTETVIYLANTIGTKAWLFLPILQNIWLEIPLIPS